MPQSTPRHQTGLNDMQMLQRQVMLKKLVELRRHNQLQELGDGRQQIYLSQLSATNKQDAGAHSSLSNATPVDDASEMSMVGNLNFGQSDKSPSLQGLPVGLPSRDQSQDLHFGNLVPQQLEVSSDGTPIERSKSNLNKYSGLHGFSRDSTNAFTGNSDNGTNPSEMRSSDLSNTCLGDNKNVSSHHLYMADGGSFSSGGQELTGWLRGYAGTRMQSNPSTGTTALDPLEQKFLFGVDDNNCNASPERDANLVTGSNKISESAEYLCSFPSVQSGSWSALMQSAVREATTGSSSQQEWNGLSSQKTELSTNMPQSNLDSGHQQTVWVGNNVQSHSSLGGKPQFRSDDSKLGSSFPGFQNLNLSTGKRQTVQPSENAWSNGPGQVLEHSEHFAPPQSIFSYNTQQARSLVGSSHLGNHLRNSHLSAPTVAAQTPPSTLHGTESKHPNFDQTASRGISRQTSFNPFGQQFPTLESMPVTQQSAVSRLYQQNGASVDPKESGACLINSEDFDYGAEHPGKGSSQQQIQQEIADQAALTNTLSYGPEHDKNLFSGAHATSMVAHSHKQNLNVAQNSCKEAVGVPFRGYEAFGQSMNPSSCHPNYSLLHQVSSNNGKDANLSGGVSEKKVGSGSGSNAQQVTAVAGYQVTHGHDAGAKHTTYHEFNVATQYSKFPASNVKMLNFSAKAGEIRSLKPSTSSLVQDASLKIAAACLPSHSLGNNSGCKNVALNRPEQSLNSLQVAPSWFKHFGSIKNGQMLPMFDASGQQYPPAKPYDDLPMNASINQVNPACPSQVNVWPTTGTTLSPSEISPHVLSPDVGDCGVSITRSKKRKSSTSELLPWHKEVTQGSIWLETIRKSGKAWSRAANRITEKVGTLADTIEDVSLLRPRKRLLVTTQLMQHIFSPAPAAILSADAYLSCGSVAYFAAKFALSDACKLICSRSDSFLSSNNDNKFSENSKTSECTRELDLSKVAEEFVIRAKKLENDLARLDEALSLVDLKVECQELEKFSVINRFAKFHFRGQRNAADNSLSDSSSSNLRKPFPQRYVTAFPMPSAVPERAPCISL